MSQATTAILYAPGINCHEETAAAIELAGGRTELVLLRDLLDGRTRLDRYQAVVIPGGFAYGDHLGAGRGFATSSWTSWRRRNHCSASATDSRCWRRPESSRGAHPASARWPCSRISRRSSRIARFASWSRRRNRRGPKD